ncbi:acetyltransferase [Aerococcus urinaeequi]|uniref:Acetyltransferase n=1 Tax=Aerococcus urinaeequi TaxID=51665 RepID=A0A7M1KR83_9LACT|nr:acetyltransferase [Aerococcus urinaeequi]QOQ78654.1 acetyltransferase [Aerococcus urinaeequi]
MSKKNLIIIGASGHGKVVAEIAELTGQYNNIYFMDDFSEKKTFHGYKNLGSAKRSDQHKDKADFFVAIGDNAVRRDKLDALIKEDYSIPTIIHPDAVISNTACIDKGTVVMAGAIINASVKVEIGTIINTNSSIDHDSTIGKYTHISPGTAIAGSVSIGNEVWIGIHASIINNINICNDAVVGAGSLVLEDIKECGTYVGIPVRKIH